VLCLTYSESIGESSFGAIVRFEVRHRGVSVLDEGWVNTHEREKDPMVDSVLEELIRGTSCNWRRGFKSTPSILRIGKLLISVDSICKSLVVL